MKNKIKVLRIITSLDPEYGGPSKAIIDSSISLVSQGFKIDILTGDAKNSNFFKSKNINIINKGPRLGNYALNFRLFNWLLKHRSRYDFFIIHGIWEFNTLAARILLKNKYFVFTHGQLDPFFRLNTFKKIKKQIYWYLFEKKNLLSSRSLLLTSSGEKNSLSQTYVKTNGIKKIIVRYGINQPKFNKTIALRYFYKKFPKLKGKKFLLFLGRFHEKKGCKILIESMKKLYEQGIKTNLLLVGPNNEYKNELVTLANNYRLKDNLIWSDIIKNNLKWGAISASEAMVLSSHGENFGVALVEALSCSKPVLTTNKVNIYKDILRSKAGYISKDETKDFVKILKKFKKLKKNQILKLGRNAKKCFKNNFDLTLKANSLANFLKSEFKGKD